MTRRNTIRVMLFAFIFLGAYIFIREPEILLRETGISNLPLGTPITWMGLIAYNLFFYSLFPSEIGNTGKIIRRILLFSLILALGWGIVSFLLSGNWANRFSNQPLHFRTWIGYTAATVLLPLISSVGWIIHRLIRYFKS